MSDRRIEGEDQFSEDEDQEWTADTDPLDMYEGIEWAILSCIEKKNTLGMSLAEILDCCDTYNVADIGTALQDLTQRKIVFHYKGKRYFIGVL